MGGDGHGHHGIPKVPDWRQYKVEDVPELLLVKNALAARGLKDPWLRNEVWRFDKGLGTSKQRMQTFFFRGFKWGLLAAIVSTIITKSMEDDHSHGDNHHH